jgi:hypothetical protein
MDEGALGKVGGTKVLFPALVFLTGFLPTGAETPSGMSSSAGGGSAATVFKVNTSLLPFMALVLYFLEA